MKRWLFNAYVAISLFFLLTIAATWLASASLVTRILLADCGLRMPISYRLIPPYTRRFYHDDHLTPDYEEVEQDDRYAIQLTVNGLKLRNYQAVSPSMANSWAYESEPESSHQWGGFSYCKLAWTTSPYSSYGKRLKQYASMVGHESILVVPLWFIVTINVFPSLAWLISNLRRRHRLNHRKRQGWCLQCGYDLRASSTQCPECGTKSTNHAQTTMTHSAVV